MKQRLKICHIITRMIVGGAKENTLLTVRGLMDKGHDVVLLTGPSTGPEGRLLGREDIPGLQVVEEPTLVRALGPWTDWRCYQRLKRHCRERRYDVVHTHSSKAGVLGRLAARHAGVPLVIHTVHGQAFHPYQAAWKNRIYIWAERVAARSCDRILAVAQAMVEQCVAARVAPREKYGVVYSGMEIDAFLNARPDPQLRARLGLPADALVVGKIARLFDLKGHDYLVEAAPAVVAAFPNVRFLLVGDGPLRQSLERAVAARGLSAHFVFAGLVSPAEVPRYTALMDLLVHLSLREGLPRTVVQALAAGIPAIGFDLDGTPEVILPGQTGLLCRTGDVPAIRDAIQTLARDPTMRRRLGQAGQALVRERFAWRRMVDLIESEYVVALARLESAAVGVRRR